MELSNEEVKTLWWFIIGCTTSDANVVMKFLASHPEWHDLARKIREEYEDVMQKAVKANR